MDARPPRHPRVSATVKRWVSWVLTAIWLVGLVVLIEVLHTGWLAPLALLAVVLLAELLFLRWNEGRWPVGAAADKRDAPKAGPGGTAG